MYQVPLKFIQIGQSMGINATRIVAMLNTMSYQARQTLKKQRQNKTLINACGRDKAKTVIILDNGSIVASPLSVAVLISRIDKATANGQQIRNPNKNAKMRVYDVIEEVDYEPEEHESVYDTKFNDILEEFENDIDEQEQNDNED